MIKIKNKPSLLLTYLIFAIIVLLFDLMIFFIVKNKINIIAVENNQDFISTLFMSQDAFFLMIPVIAFTFADIALWNKFILLAFKTSKRKKILNEGVEYTATYISHFLVFGNNYKEYFSITYTFDDGYGKTIKTNSDTIYTLAEALAFKKVKTFKIKVDNKNNSVIITDPSVLLKENNIEELFEEEL